jgi:hypothetical protein
MWESHNDFHDSVEDNNRLTKLQNGPRKDHLNSEERVSFVKIFYKYNNVFHLLGDKLAFITGAELWQR